MSLFNLLYTVLTATSIVTTSNSAPIDVRRAESISIQVIADVNTPAAKTFDSGVYEIQTLTFEDLAGTDHQDWVNFYDQSGGSWAIALTKPVAAVDTVDFPDTAGAAPGDYAAFYDAAGLRWAFSLNTTGADPEPTGAIWTAIPAGRKVHVDISGVANDEDVSPLVETALNALTGFSAAFTTDDTAADGTMLVTRDAKGATSATVVKSEDDSGAGSITMSTTTEGVTSEAPSGVLWTAIAAGKKDICDVSAASTAAQVAAAVELCIDALTDLTAVITTDDTAADGTMTLTQVVQGPTTNPVPKNADESGAGGILGVQSTAGVATEVDPDADTLSIPTHALITGLKGQLTTTGTLPTGLALATDYFVIVVDANTIQLAASYADAIAGAEIDITDYGAVASVNTFTPTAIAGANVRLQKSNSTKAEIDAGTAVWDDEGSATNITADGDIWLEKASPGFNWARVRYTLTAGSLSATANVVVKGRQ